MDLPLCPGLLHPDKLLVLLSRSLPVVAQVSRSLKLEGDLKASWPAGHPAPWHQHRVVSWSLRNAGGCHQTTAEVDRPEGCGCVTWLAPLGLNGRAAGAIWRCHEHQNKDLTADFHQPLSPPPDLTWPHLSFCRNSGPHEKAPRHQELLAPPSPLGPSGRKDRTGQESRSCNTVYCPVSQQTGSVGRASQGIGALESLATKAVCQQH